MSTPEVNNSENEVVENPRSGVDYKSKSSQYVGATFIFECCKKLKVEVRTTAIAATYYHRFFEFVGDSETYEQYSIGSTCIYIASKMTNDDVKVRDIINVTMNTLHPDKEPLTLEKYFILRSSLINTELLVMRILGFDLEVDLPHKYLLHFLSALKDWLGDDVFNTLSIVKTSWTLLQDSFHIPLLLKHSPQLIAAATIYLTLQIYGVIVPGCDELGDKPWYLVLHPDCSTANIWAVTSSIIDIYKQEEELL